MPIIIPGFLFTTKPYVHMKCFMALINGRNMTSVKLKLNKDRVLLNGTYPLVFQIIHSRRKKLIYSPFRVAGPEFDTVKEKVVYCKDRLTHREVRSINRWIIKERKKLNGLIGELKKCMPDFTVADIAGYYEG